MEKVALFNIQTGSTHEYLQAVAEGVAKSQPKTFRTLPQILEMLESEEWIPKHDYEKAQVDDE